MTMIIANKSLIIISFISFIVFICGLAGIYLFLKSLLNPFMFFSETNKYFDNNTDFEKVGFEQARIKQTEFEQAGNRTKSNYIYFNNNNNSNSDKQFLNIRQLSWIRFKTTLINIYEKRKVYFLLIIFIFLLIIFFILFKNIFVACFIALMSTAVLNEFICNVFRKRKEILDVQLIEFITNIIIMLKAGKEIRQIFKESVTCIKNPLKNHIRNLVNEIELNISMDNALDRFAANIGGNEVKLLSNAIKINRKIGGNLLFILEKIIETLQQNIKIKSTIKTQTAQNRFSGNFIALFPLIGFIAMYIFFNSAVLEFLSSKIGNILLAVGSLFEFSGFFIIKKILKEDLI
ncbi:MAG: type II secretion system F family protein [Actinobacteria bacterium]|nr:type II secretion system F family protein [Actinomycetota bacterium]